jgi:hypothetical protein
MMGDKLGRFMSKHESTLLVILFVIVLVLIAIDVVKLSPGFSQNAECIYSELFEDDQEAA